MPSGLYPIPGLDHTAQLAKQSIFTTMAFSSINPPPAYCEVEPRFHERPPSYRSVGPSVSETHVFSSSGSSLITCPTESSCSRACDATVRSALEDMKSLRHAIARLALDTAEIDADAIITLTQEARLIKRSASHAVRRHHGVAEEKILVTSRLRYESRGELDGRPILRFLKDVFLNTMMETRIRLRVLKTRRDSRLSKLEDAMDKLEDQCMRIQLIQCGYLFSV